MKVLIDGAQSFGATYYGKRVGNWGRNHHEFFSAKPLGCYGDGGAIFTNNDADADVFRSICLHGRGSEKYEHVTVGVNSRLDTIQAAILLQKLKVFPSELHSRSEIAKRYDAAYQRRI